MQVKLSIVIVNWNSAAYVRQCLRSILQTPPPFTFEVIVIDNGSFDSCGQMLAREFPTVAFLQSDANVGFSRANNMAARRANGAALLFLNPDTEVYPGALEQLVEVLDQHPNAGAVGGRLLNSDGSLQTTSIQAFPTLLNQFFDSDLMRRWFPRWSIWKTSALAASSGIVPGIESISGACLLTTRRVYDQIGGLNEAFFMYSEDTDYCFMTRQLGLTNYYVPGAVILHHGGKSSGGTFSKFSAIMLQESVWRFLAQRKSPSHALMFRVAVTLKAIARLAVLIIAWPPGLLTTRSAWLDDAIRKWSSILRWALGMEQSWVGRYQRSIAR